MKPKLLVDMNLSPMWVQYFRDHGFESLHWADIGKPSAPDAEILDYARRNGMVVFTHDLDFGALLARQKTQRPSVIQIRAQDVLPAGIGEVVVRAIIASLFHLDAGALVTVDPNRNRIRLLPI